MVQTSLGCWVSCEKVLMGFCVQLVNLLTAPILKGTVCDCHIFFFVTFKINELYLLILEEYTL